MGTACIRFYRGPARGSPMGNCALLEEQALPSDQKRFAFELIAARRREAPYAVDVPLPNVLHTGRRMPRIGGPRMIEGFGVPDALQRISSPDPGSPSGHAIPSNGCNRHFRIPPS